MIIYRRIIIILCAVTLLAGTVPAPAQEDDKLLAIRRAFYRTTGYHWDDATPSVQEKYLKIFERQERTRAKFEKARKKVRERAERNKMREKLQEQRQLEAMEKTFMRRKRQEEREIAREKRERDRKMKEMKKKAQRMRRKNN